jgi:hypothetical protein
MEEVLPDDRRLKIDADESLLEWLNKCSNQGIKCVHVHVEPLKPFLSPMVEDTAFVDGTNETDNSYDLSDDDSVSVPIPSFHKDDSPHLDSDFDAFSDKKGELYGSDNDGDRPYLDKAYRG